MGKAAFTKGQKVTRIINWDSKGAFCFQQAIVESCGIKRMTLKCEESGHMMGRDFKPVAGGEGDYTNCHTFPRVSDEEAAVKCVELAKAYLTKERAYLEQKKADDNDPAYWDKKISALHQPRAHKNVERFAR